MMSSSATPSEKEIRILIADDHPIVCEGLIAVFALEDDLKVVGHAHDGEEACLLCKQLCPDIIILDLRMPKKDGIEVVIELMSQKPAPVIIVLTHSAKEEDIRRALARERKASRHATPDAPERIDHRRRCTRHDHRTCCLSAY